MSASTEMQFSQRPMDRILVADVGGTNVRFALCDPCETQPILRQVCSTRCADYPSLAHAVRDYLRKVGAHPRNAVFAIASPVGIDPVRLTNSAWEFSRAEVQAQLGLERLLLINDFEAVALAVPTLCHADFEWLRGAPDTGGWKGPVSVLGPGTGLGAAVLMELPGARWHPVATEGGHASFAPLDREERQIERWIRRRYGRCSIERLLSGPGLSDIHAALRSGTARIDDAAADTLPESARSPADLVSAALAGADQLATRTLARFCAVLGSVAGDMAMMQGARAVVIAGGIAPRLVPILRNSAFNARFVAKGRMTALLSAIPVAVVVHPQPGLVGAALAIGPTSSR